MEEVATFAGGCFWCTEAVFNDVIGVLRVESGYTGGSAIDPTYEDVCSGRTGHAEAVKIRFDPRQISYEDLLDIFFHTHDPTQLNRQGNDVGTQYRSAIFTHSETQKRAAEAAIACNQQDWPDPIVTTVQPAQDWYSAEGYHQHYFQQMGDKNPYCVAVVAPKLRKFRKSFAGRLKSEVT